MFHKLSKRRGRAAAATVALLASVLSLAFAGSAGAVTTSVIGGSGSNTIYQLDTDLSVLFNESPGCNLAGGSPQPLDFSCPTPYATGGVVNQPGEDGETAAMENPYNDVTYQYPALGSGNGVHQLQGNAGSGDGEPDINYARSSATPGNSHGTSQQNYVQFAIDGVSWVHFTQQGGTNLPTSSVGNVQLSALQHIYADTLQCKIGGVIYKMDWACLGAPTHLHIDCYMAQNGSGTEGTWAQYVTGGSSTPACLNDETTGTAASHNGLFENEVSSITQPSSAYYNNDVGAAIYFFSFAKYKQECVVGGVSGACPGATGYTTSIGAINGIHPTQFNIQGTGGANHGTFPIIRYLSNVYNNSSATGTAGTAAAPATQAALNLVSEYGFLCKSSTATDIDPYTGYNYRYEIEATIFKDGFFPIDVGYHRATQTPGTAFAEENTALTYPAQITDPNYQLVDSTYNQTNPTGYCLPIDG